jgi:GTP-binding protein HflX
MEILSGCERFTRSKPFSACCSRGNGTIGPNFTTIFVSSTFRAVSGEFLRTPLCSDLVMPENVLIVGVILPDVSKSAVEEHVEELEKLVETAGGVPVARVIAKRSGRDAATYVGSGKAEEIHKLAELHKVSLVVFDDDLSPAQIRNLEEVIAAKVIDRSALILDIFARRARSRESRTQVELAQLSYLLPRLTRQWSHLSRQGGGIGTRGVGETQLESDRRMTRTRIARLREELDKIERTRETQRKGRTAAFTVALVGYTNAGKSTLFNRLTGGNAEAIDKLFATLDAKLQRSSFEMPRETVIIDTVGFIRKLPHHLVASFRSTMEEAVSADLVLHVINGAHPHYDEQRTVGEEVLRDLGIPADRVIDVYNKCDQMTDGQELPHTLRRRDVVTVSALTGTNIPHLLGMIRERELAGGETVRLQIPIAESKVIAALHERAVIHEESSDDAMLTFRAWIPTDALHYFQRFTVADRPAHGSARAG